MIGIDNSIIDFCKQLEIYIQSDYYKSQIAIGAFSTRFDKFLLENERARDHLFMIDILKGEVGEKDECLDLLEDTKNAYAWWIDEKGFKGEPDKSDHEHYEKLKLLLAKHGRTDHA